MGSVRILSEDDVRQGVSVQEAQQIIEQAFKDFANGISRMHARVTVPIPDIAGNMRLLPAVKVLPTPSPMPPTRGYLGVKLYTGYVGPAFKDREKPRFVVLLYDMRDGALLAMIAARWLGALRTGATSAVATRHMARPGAASLCIVGTGEQAETQLLCVASLLKPERIVVTSRDAAHREAFAAQAQAAGWNVSATGDCEDAARTSDVICLATTSREPVIRAGWIRPGTHINAVGANVATRREVDTDLVRAARTVVEYRLQALQEAGDLVIPVQEEAFSEDHIAAELGEIVTGAKPGRTSPEEITLFKSIGVAIEDVAMAAYVYERAVTQGAGTVVTM
jgi:ornithine cyclodeaminase/alanine dehydrogenase-like protein (mu-crystallin family)